MDDRADLLTIDEARTGATTGGFTGQAPDATTGLVGPADLSYKDAVTHLVNVENFQDSIGGDGGR